MSLRRELRVSAIELEQSPGRSFYLFGIDGKLVHSFATISRLKRNGDGDPAGYQRPEVLSHISEIRDYVESKSPLIPNAIVIAFDDRVRFEPALPFVQGPGYSKVGTLVIPCDEKLSDSEKPGFIVDGQQRLAAIRDSNRDSFPIAATAFVAKDVRQQVEQFILINSTKPLQKALIYELLPNTAAKLPTPLERRKFPCYLLDRLNRDDDSPFRGRIQTPTNPQKRGALDGTIRDNSVLRMIENSLSDGVLFRFRGDESHADDVTSMLCILKNFWGAVARVFPKAWNETPRRSRLVHGVGVVSLGFIMDAAGERRRKDGVPSLEDFADDLVQLADCCRWTDGYWEFGPNNQRKWNELQNTSRDIQLLANYLRGQYQARVWNSARPKPRDLRQRSRDGV